MKLKFLTIHFFNGVPNQSPKSGETAFEHAKRFLGLCAEAYISNNDTPLSTERSDRIGAYAALDRHRNRTEIPEIPWIKEFITLCKKVASSLMEKEIFTSEKQCFGMLHDFLTGQPYEDEMIAFFDELCTVLEPEEKRQSTAEAA